MTAQVGQHYSGANIEATQFPLRWLRAVRSSRFRYERCAQRKTDLYKRQKLARGTAEKRPEKEFQDSSGPPNEALRAEADLGEISLFSWLDRRSPMSRDQVLMLD